MRSTKELCVTQLSEKHIAFCSEYCKTRNVFQAAEAADISLSTILPTTFYVYFLIEKETGRIFYVGKGTGNRVLRHFQPYRIENVFKANEIADIRHRGKTPAYVIFATDENESKAFQVERLLIDALAHTGLTNELKGCTSLLEQELVRTRRILDSIMPYELWLSIKPRSAQSKSNYRFIVRELKSILANHPHLLTHGGS